MLEYETEDIKCAKFQITTCVSFETHTQNGKWKTARAHKLVKIEDTMKVDISCLIVRERRFVC